MNRIFEPRGFFTVPDGTEVSPFMNATDVMQHDVPWGALGQMSIAGGRIGPGVTSSIHMHPVVTQVTYLVDGRITISMKQPDNRQPYELELQPGQAVLTEPGTLFQLRNRSLTVAEVLYIVSPSYVFEMSGAGVAYDDAVIVAANWGELERTNYEVPALKTPHEEAAAKRVDSLSRLAARKMPLTSSLGEKVNV